MPSTNNTEHSGRQKISNFVVMTLVIILLVNGDLVFGQTLVPDTSRYEEQLESEEENCRYQGHHCDEFNLRFYGMDCERENQRRVDDCKKNARSNYKRYLETAQTQAENRFKDSLKLVVMLEGEMAGQPVFGAGIIVGLGKDRAYIVTANHVVRRATQQASNLQLLLRISNNQRLKASLENHFDTNTDIAILTVEGLEKAEVNYKQFQFRQLGNLAALKRNADVYPVGNPNGVAWGYPVAPDKVSEVFGDNITFQSSFITVGHSGGALINQDGLLIGMIQKDAPPFGVARNLVDIITKVKSWGIPVNLKQP